MDRNKFSQNLTVGLMHGYAGAGHIKIVERDDFKGKQSSVPLRHGNYHDEWFGHSSGGGQELVSIGNQQFTRVYAGGTPETEKLSELGITAADVAAYLKKKIVELKEQTRLFTNCHPQADGDWQYSYEVIEDHPAINIVTAKERITYKGFDTHIHIFLLCPVK